ncbi:MAG: hypothetical protein FWF84_03160 [Kiritimatiellaeota bacterium]|nr:hypothetical protein [Kiritimatiellota bacterium]
MNFMKKIQAIALAGLFCVGTSVSVQAATVGDDFEDGYIVGNFYEQTTGDEITPYTGPWVVALEDESEIVSDGAYSGYSLKLATEGNELLFDAGEEFRDEDEATVGMWVKFVGADAPPVIEDGNVKVALYYNDGSDFEPYIAPTPEDGYWACECDPCECDSCDCESGLEDCECKVWVVTQEADPGQPGGGIPEGLYAYVFTDVDGFKEDWVLLEGITVKTGEWTHVEITVTQDDGIAGANYVSIKVNGLLATGIDGFSGFGDSGLFYGANIAEPDEYYSVQSVAFSGTGMIDNFSISTEEIVYFDVIFDVGGTPYQVSVASGTTFDVAKALAETTKGPFDVPAGYSIIGWTNALSNDEFILDSFEIEANETFYAVLDFEPSPPMGYTVAFIGFNGANYYVTNDVASGTLFGAIKPTDPTELGYVFNGWTNIANGVAVTNEYAIVDNLTVAGVWSVYVAPDWTSIGGIALNGGNVGLSWGGF